MPIPGMFYTVTYGLQFGLLKAFGVAYWLFVMLAVLAAVIATCSFDKTQIILGLLCILA